MLGRESERVRYDSNYDFDYDMRDNRYSRYDYEDRYEADRRRTSDSYRDSLKDSLERAPSRSRLERADDSRYGFYMSNIDSRENNYDRFWDRKQAQAAAKSPASRKKTSLLVAYAVLALVAILAVTLSVVGLGSKEVVVKSKPVLEPLAASAEENVAESVGESAIEVVEPVAAEAPETEEEAICGENYMLLSNGEIVEVQIPTQVKKTQEEEKGFDKFCSWLNGVFGG